MRVKDVRKLEVLRSLEAWILRVCDDKKMATPEEVAALPKVAELYLIYSSVLRPDTKKS